MSQRRNAKQIRADLRKLHPSWTNPELREAAARLENEEIDRALNPEPPEESPQLELFATPAEAAAK